MADNESGVTNKYPMKYRLTAEMFDEKFDDVNSFTCFRCPITKTASFSIMAINLRTKYYLTIEEKCRNNEFELVTVNFDITTGYSTSDDNLPPKVDEVGKKQYLILHAEPYEAISPLAPYVLTTLYLVNPVLYYLQSTNGFNEILEDITAYDALGKFESWLTSAFGGTSFKFNKAGEDYEKNDHRYEQILARQNNDLMIPTNLLQNYKLWNTYGYYFFDDFRFDDKSQSDIIGYAINLGDINQFNTKNLFDDKDTDVFAANSFQKAQPIADRFNILYQEKPSLIIKCRNQEFGFRKAKDEKEIPQLDAKISQGSYATAESCNIVKTEITGKSFKATEQTLIYSPDNVPNGIKRFDKVSAQLRNNIQAIETYYLHDCHVDFIQFDQRYNFMPYDQNKYLHVPIAICNMFVRESGRVSMFSHNIKYQMMKYKDPQESGSWTSGGSFQDHPM